MRSCKVGDSMNATCTIRTMRHSPAGVDLVVLSELVDRDHIAAAAASARQLGLLLIAASQGSIYEAYRFVCPRRFIGAAGDADGDARLVQRCQYGPDVRAHVIVCSRAVCETAAGLGLCSFGSRDTAEGR